MTASHPHDRTIGGGRRVRQLTFRSPSGLLEGVLFCRIEEKPAAVAVFCHPHPAYGGSMHNKVAYRASEALFEAGLPALRFNFRGVGRSQGAWSGGPGEEEDAGAAIGFMDLMYPDLPVLLGGFSFGGGVALAVGARHPRVAAMLAVAPAVGARDLAPLARCPKPKAVIQGTQDDLCPLPVLEESYARWSEPKALRRMDGAGHFFDGRTAELKAAVHEALGGAEMAAALDGRRTGR